MTEVQSIEEREAELGGCGSPFCFVADKERTYSHYYTGFRIYGPRFCPDKVDHIAEMTMYSKNVVLKSD